METAAFFGSNLPNSKLAEISYCKKSSLYLSFTLCSNVPKPEVCLLADKEMVPKSARLKSTLPNAAQPPLSSIEDKRNSFTHISPQAPPAWLVFSTPIKTPPTSAKLGLPITAYSCPLACAWRYILVVGIDGSAFRFCFNFIKLCKSISSASDASHKVSLYFAELGSRLEAPKPVKFNGILI